MKRLNILMSTLLIAICSLEANVSGIVFKDLPLDGNITNIYGEQDSNEQGIEGVTVTAYPDNISVTTDSNGTWSLNTTSAKVRIEFSNWSSYLKESTLGTNNKSSVQFINNNDTANLALHNPNDFSTNTPLLATTHFINGKNGLNLAEPTIFAWPYSNKGAHNSNQEILATTDSIRSVWGLAYDKTNQILYSSTLLKRHVSIGSDGLGTIYITDLNNSITSLFQIVPNVGSIDNEATRGLDETNLPNTDASTFAKIAKVGLGDISISEEKSILYAMNLNDKKIYEIDTNTKSIIKSYAAPGPTCTNGELRPFALTVHENSLYVGSVCDASTSSCVVTESGGYCPELTAQVYQVPLGTTSGSEIFQMRLDYKKELVHILQPIAERHNWNPWTDTYADILTSDRIFHPSPILSNIKFDESNNMFLAFTDRSTLQTGARQNDINGTNLENIVMSGGDILKAKLENNNSYTLLDVNLYDDNTSAPVHQEGALGAVAYLKGSNEIVFTEYDPYDTKGNGQTYDTKGVTFNNATTGLRTQSYEVAAENLPSYFGKGTSIGDLEIITDAAPTNIGNRIWFDDNKNCIQDANESGIDGIKLQLLDENTNLIDSTVTANGGKYLFENITPNKNYIIRVEDLNQTELNNTKLATDCSSVNNILIDSSAVQNALIADISVPSSSIKIAGANNYSFDIGFQEKTTNTFGILDNYIWSDTDQNGIQDNNESGINGLTVNLYNSLDCTGAIFNTTTTINGGSANQDGFYQFTNLPSGNYCVEVDNLSNFSVVANTNANSSGQIQNINLTADISSQNIALAPQTAVAAATTTESCSCNSYEEKAVSLYSNIFIFLLIIGLNSIAGIILFRKESKI